MDRKSTFAAVALVAMLHMIIAFACGVIGMGDFGDHPVEPSAVERAARQAALVLSAPMRWIWNNWMSRNVPDAVEWGVFFGNSLLWGGALVLIWNAWNSRRRKAS